MIRNIKLITDHPIAIDSPDHLEPWGTMRDNSTDNGFIQEVVSRFQRKINFIDLGCSGGRLVREMIPYSEYAIGLEGSDYSILHQRAEWPDLNQKNLFTCDISQPFRIVDDQDTPIKFDCITAWEVVEHIDPERMNQFFLNIQNLMHPESIFCCSISYIGDVVNGRELHQTIWSEEEWNNYFSTLGCFEDTIPIQKRVRNERFSIQRTFRLKKDKVSFKNQ